MKNHLLQAAFRNSSQSISPMSSIGLALMGREDDFRDVDLEAMEAREKERAAKLKAATLKKRQATQV